MKAAPGSVQAHARIPGGHPGCSVSSGLRSLALGSRAHPAILGTGPSFCCVPHRQPPSRAKVFTVMGSRRLTGKRNVCK